LELNKFTSEKEMFFRKKLSEWFKKSNLKRELIANLWHPKNYEKFKYYDLDMFSNEEDE
jgi:dephospho-CoA kinase